jgi:hypothetical protein
LRLARFGIKFIRSTKLQQFSNIPGFIAHSDFCPIPFFVGNVICSDTLSLWRLDDARRESCDIARILNGQINKNPIYKNRFLGLLTSVPQADVAFIANVARER